MYRPIILANMKRAKKTQQQRQRQSNNQTTAQQTKTPTTKREHSKTPASREKRKAMISKKTMVARMKKGFFAKKTKDAFSTIEQRCWGLQRSIGLHDKSCHQGWNPKSTRKTRWPTCSHRDVSPWQSWWQSRLGAESSMMGWVLLAGWH